MRLLMMVCACGAVACGSPDTDPEFGSLEEQPGASGAGGSSGVAAAGGAGNAGSAVGDGGAAAAGGSEDAGPGCNRACDTPPAAHCLDAVTLRAYADAGHCSPTGCQYEPIDSVCGQGCKAGACQPCTEETLVVDAAGDVGASPAIASATDGTLTIAYRDVANKKLKIASRVASGEFSIKELDASNAGGTSLQADGDALSLFYQGSASPKLALKAPGGAFSTQSAKLGAMPSTHLVHAAGVEVFTALNGSVQHATWSSDWVAQAALTIGTTGCSVKPGVMAAARDSKGGLHAVARCGLSRMPLYAHRPAGGSWSSQTLDSTGGDHVAILVDDGDTVYVAYRKDVASKLMIASPSFLGGGILPKAVGEGGQYVTLARGRSGVSHAIYMKNWGQLAHAIHKPGQTGWSEVGLLDAHHAGETASTTDAEGVVHVAYRATQAKDLKYTRICPE